MTELRQRTPRVECPAFLAFVRRRPCRTCPAPAPSEAAHIRIACLDRGKEYTGRQQKPDDRWAVPLCHLCHRNGPQAQHRGSEREFWRLRGIDPFGEAERLWAEFCTSDSGAKARPQKRKRRPPMGDREREAIRRSMRRAWAEGRAGKIEHRAKRWATGRKIESRGFPR